MKVNIVKDFKRASDGITTPVWKLYVNGVYLHTYNFQSVAYDTKEALLVSEWEMNKRKERNR